MTPSTSGNKPLINLGSLGIADHGKVYIVSSAFPENMSDHSNYNM